jgi:GH15 family glucan-1,4-alpha-glucosidase
MRIEDCGLLGDMHAASLVGRVGVTHDLGLLAEKYDVNRQRQVGNFPQAFSDLKLIGAARAISEGRGGDKPVSRIAMASF